jgi:hypothetical protein
LELHFIGLGRTKCHRRIVEEKYVLYVFEEGAREAVSLNAVRAWKVDGLNLLANGSRKFLFDLRLAKGMYGLGWGELAEFIKTVRESGGGVVLLLPDNQLCETVRTLNVSQFFDWTLDLAEAERLLAGKEGGVGI